MNNEPSSTAASPSKVTEQEIWDQLRNCYDPEIPLNVVDLGLIYDVKAGSDEVQVKMSVTSPACPSGSVIADDIKMK